MTCIANRIARLGLAGSVALLAAVPVSAATPTHQPVEAWSAMQGVAPAALLQDIEDMPLSDMAIDDQPYCASDAEIAQTLDHDFSERRVDAEGNTELWGSDQMGTWTLVAAREDQTSCIIASGIGYTDRREAEVYFRTAGL
ncbi:hypothetical protein [Paracoccus beibuensis]|uniref:hypothetical protein n=1 Tax=Paracoccus beibuensis TaxID=547602 RepID=UPI00223F3C58|nr:hypothetical protein [Paracoccus beibuensis]